jgi:hypothetical protein
LEVGVGLEGGVFTTKGQRRSTEVAEKRKKEDRQECLFHKEKREPRVQAEGLCYRRVCD